MIDANGNPVQILGELDTQILTPKGSFVTSTLVFVKNPAVVHHVLLGMNVLKKTHLRFCEKNDIIFEDIGDNNTTPDEDIFQLKLVDTNIRGVHLEPAVYTHQPTENYKSCEATVSPKATPSKLPLYLTKEILIPKNSTNTLKLPVNINQMSNLFINSHQMKELYIPSMYTEVKQNQLTVQMTNFTDEDILLTAGTEIGHGELASEVVNVSPNQYLNVAQLSEDESFRPLTKEDIQCDDPQMTKDVIKLLNDHRKASWLPNEPLGNYKGDELEIKQNIPRVINKPPYKIPYAYQAELDKVLSDMLREGIIERSKSSYNSPLIIIKKPDNSIRVCIDLRELNKIIEPVSYPLPKISELLNSLGQSGYMSTLDLAQAFHQCNIKPSDREKTAFTVKNTKYQYVRVPFGLQSSPAFFARIINEVLYDVLGPNCLAYLDDLVIFSKTKEQHLKTLKQVLEKLQGAGIKLKIKKCHFFANNINFLGYKISKDGMTMTPDKAAAINAMPLPVNKKQLQAFLGTCNYFRIFIRNFAQLAEPLYALLRKQVRFIWTDEQTKAVNSLKSKLSSAPIVKFPNYELSFHLHTDASKTGIGAVLMQEYNGILHPVAYISKTLNKAQRSYSTTKREALALVYALEQFRHIILMFNITVYTDHKPLLGALNKPTKDECLQRWSLLIQEYKINLMFIEGKNNIFSDTLSRLPDPSTASFDEQFQEKLNSRNNFCNYLNEYIPEKVSWSEIELRNKQNKDSTCKNIVAQFTNTGDNQQKSALIPDCKILNGILYVIRKIKRGSFTDLVLVPYIPDSLMPSAFKIIHDDLTAGHKGPDRTLKLFVKNFYNARERHLIKEYCDQCVTCIRAKKSPKLAPLSKYDIPVRPFHTIVSDIIGPLRITEAGNTYILTVRDYTTRYTILFPLAHKNTDSIIDALRRVISNFGSSKVLLTDNAPEYKSEKLKEFLKYYNCSKVEVSPYHAASMGFAERINREVNKLMRMYIFELNMSDWDTLLPTIQLTINSTFNASINETPFFALFGYDSATDILSPSKLSYNEDALHQHLQRISQVRIHCRNHLLKAQQEYTQYTNKNRPTKEIAIGHRVYANISKHRSTARQKLDLPISGPFTVTGRTGKAWRLKEIATKNSYVVHPDFIIPSTAKITTNTKHLPKVERQTNTDDSGSDSEPENIESVTVNNTPPATPTALSESNCELTPPDSPVEPVPGRTYYPRACKR